MVKVMPWRQPPCSVTGFYSFLNAASGPSNWATLYQTPWKLLGHPLVTAAESWQLWAERWEHAQCGKSELKQFAEGQVKNPQKTIALHSLLSAALCSLPARCHEMALASEAVWPKLMGTEQSLQMFLLPWLIPESLTLALQEG